LEPLRSYFLASGVAEDQVMPIVTAFRHEKIAKGDFLFISLLAQAELLATVMLQFPVWYLAGFIGSTLWLGSSRSAL